MAKTKVKVKTKAQADPVVIHISGRLDETSRPAMEELAKLAAKTLVIDFKGLNFISSMGIQHWIWFARGSEGKEIILQNCPSVFINQVNLIHDMLENCVVESFETDFYCETCHTETSKTLQTSLGLEKIKDQSSGVPCQKCGAPLLLEMPPEQYYKFFSFIGNKKQA